MTWEGRARAAATASQSEDDFCEALWHSVWWLDAPARLSFRHGVPVVNASPLGRPTTRGEIPAGSGFRSEVSAVGVSWDATLRDLSPVTMGAHAAARRVREDKPTFAVQGGFHCASPAWVILAINLVPQRLPRLQRVGDPLVRFLFSEESEECLSLEFQKMVFSDKLRLG